MALTTGMSIVTGVVAVTVTGWPTTRVAGLTVTVTGTDPA
jgi:hypothetical protein